MGVSKEKHEKALQGSVEKHKNITQMTNGTSSMLDFDASRFEMAYCLPQNIGPVLSLTGFLGAVNECGTSMILILLDLTFFVLLPMRLWALRHYRRLIHFEPVTMATDSNDAKEQSNDKTSTNEDGNLIEWNEDNLSKESPAFYEEKNRGKLYGKNRIIHLTELIFLIMSPDYAFYQIVWTSFVSLSWLFLSFTFAVEIFYAYDPRNRTWSISFLLLYAVFANGVRWKFWPQNSAFNLLVLQIVSYSIQCLLFIIHWSHTPRVGNQENVEVSRRLEQNERELQTQQVNRDLVPLESANFFSKLFFVWLNPLVVLANQRVLEDADVPDLPKFYHSDYVAPAFDKAWQNEQKKHKERASLYSALSRSLGRSFYLAAFPKLFNDASQFVGPLLLSRLIAFAQSPDEPMWVGVLYSFGIFVGMYVGTLGENQYFFMVMGVGQQVRTALTHAIYSKCLRLSNGARGRIGSGNIVNLVSSDVEKISEALTQIHGLWASPLRIFIALGLLFNVLGWATLAGLFGLVVLIPFQGKLIRRMVVYQKATLGAADARLKSTNDLLSGVRVVKFFHWETSFRDKLGALRDIELVSLKKTTVLRAINFMLMNVGPLLVSSLSYLVFSLIPGNTLTPSIAFTSLALFQVLRFPLIFFPRIVAQVVELSVSLNRIRDLLLAEEMSDLSWLEPPPSPQEDTKRKAPNQDNKKRRSKKGGKRADKPASAPAARAQGGTAILVENSTFVFEEDVDHKAPAPTEKGKGGDEKQDKKSDSGEKKTSSAAKEEKKEGAEKNNGSFELVVDSLRIPDQSFVVVVGETGSGKTALLQALLRQMEQKKTTDEQKADSDDSSSATLTKKQKKQLAKQQKKKASPTPVCQVNGTIAYVPQSAWIFNETVQNNILLHGELRRDDYVEAVRLACLESDLEGLAAGDLTELGAGGVNLSGGQKQRVSIARALYADADVYLLDDPLSALDSKVARRVFEDALKKKLADRTRVLVTHQLQFCHEADWIVVMNHGRIVAQGPYDELLQTSALFQQMMSEEAGGGQKSSRSGEFDEERAQLKEAASKKKGKKSVSLAVPGGSSAKSSKKKPAQLRWQDSRAFRLFAPGMASKRPQTMAEAMAAKEAALSQRTRKQEEEGMVVTEDELNEAKLVAKETKAEGAVRNRVYADFLRAAGGIFMTLLTVGLALTFSQTALAFSSVWLSWWSSGESFGQADGGPRSTGFYLGIYFGINILAIMADFSMAVSFALLAVRASRSLHAGLLWSVLRAKTQFFDQTPAGRIINRFAKDMGLVDLVLPFSLQLFVSGMGGLAATVVIIAVNVPRFLVVFILAFALYFHAQKYFRCSSRELKRIDSVSRSPIYANVTETLAGLGVIRAFRIGDRMLHRNLAAVDANQRAILCKNSSNRWLSIRLEALGTLMIFAAALFATLSRSSLSPAVVGLVISYALQITALLTMISRLYAETEMAFNAVERILEYGHLKPEAPFEIEGHRSPYGWPTNGEIVMKDVTMRYRSDLPPVLNKFSVHIKGGEKIGIVGRTGAGKSSLFVTLFRMVEIDEGTICIDGVDVSQIGLGDLRRALSIIPQDPVMFSGTIAENLDPFGKYPVEDLWSAVKRAHLGAFISQLPGKLQYTVEEGGSNFSVGQRQLICLARALLSPAKILIIDEATASVDHHTDLLIQKTIREHFADRTVLAIAHRISTIVDSDRVMVLDAGQAKEFDTPANLLGECTVASAAQKGSKKKGRATKSKPPKPTGPIFCELVQETGPESAAHLRDIASGRVHYLDVLREQHDTAMHELHKSFQATLELSTSKDIPAITLN